MSLNPKLAGLFNRQSRGWIISEAIALVIAIGVIDYLTGYEVLCFPFYSIPIFLVVWFGGMRAAIFISILSVLVWRCADSAAGHVYSREWLRNWDTVVRWMSFYLVIIVGVGLKKERDADQAKIELLERSQKLEQEIISISEREQQRIGQDIHDSLGQHLIAIGFAADSLQDSLQKKSLPEARAGGQIATLVHEAVDRARDLARGLSPVDDDEGGLESALEQLASSASRLSGISCSFICHGIIPTYENNKAVHLFRIAQEAVNNATKHAQAKAIVMMLETIDGVLALRVSDDGIGGVDAGRGSGILGLTDRVEALGGTISIASPPRGGTTLSVQLPTTP